MGPLERLEEVALLSLLLALGFSYVLDRVHLIWYGRLARKIVADLEAMETHLYQNASLENTDAAIARLSKLELHLTTTSKRLITWRSSPMERFIIGGHIDTLLFQYERAGAMTTRLAALIRVRSLNGSGPQGTSIPA